MYLIDMVNECEISRRLELKLAVFFGYGMVITYADMQDFISAIDCKQIPGAGKKTRAEARELANTLYDMEHNYSDIDEFGKYTELGHFGD